MILYGLSFVKKFTDACTGKVGDRKSVENDKSDKNGAYFYLFSTVQQ